MALKSFFKFMISGSKEMDAIKEKVAQLQEEVQEKEESESFNVEHLTIEKLIIEKLEYQNNFGALGIKELSGKLNIGANYDHLPLKNFPEMPEEFTPIAIKDKKDPPSHRDSPPPPSTPKYEIRGRKK
ncbi:MAG: hypothetical protein WBV93_07365 [Anaerobacillus sp.]